VVLLIIAGAGGCGIPSRTLFLRLSAGFPVPQRTVCGQPSRLVLQKILPVFKFHPCDGLFVEPDFRGIGAYVGVDPVAVLAEIGGSVPAVEEAVATPEGGWRSFLLPGWIGRFRAYPSSASLSQGCSLNAVLKVFYASSRELRQIVVRAFHGVAQG